MLIKTVEISPSAKRDLKKVPAYIIDKLLSWIHRVEQVGVEEVRKLKGYHGEPLHGIRKGQRSIRLSHAYRAIYVIRDRSHAQFIRIEEAHKHDY